MGSRTMIDYAFVVSLSTSLGGRRTITPGVLVFLWRRLPIYTPVIIFISSKFLCAFRRSKINKP